MNNELEKQESAGPRFEGSAKQLPEDDGIISPELSKNDSSIKSKMPEILEAIDDANFPLAEVSRLIAMEIGYLTVRMNESPKTRVISSLTDKPLDNKALMEQVKSLREMAKSLTEADMLAKRDILNFDGAKFQYWFTEVVGLFKKAVTEAVGKDNDSMVQSIMKHFRDIMAIKDEQLRRDTEKIDSNKK